MTTTKIREPLSALLIAGFAFAMSGIAWAADAAVEKHDVKVIVNGVPLPLSAQRKAVSQALGKPDRIVKTPYECASAFDAQENVRAHYYGKTELEVHGKEAFFRTVDLTDKRFRLLLDGTTLDNQTTLASLQRRYPSGSVGRNGFYPLEFDLQDEDARIYLGFSPKTKTLTAFYFWMEC